MMARHEVTYDPSVTYSVSTLSQHWGCAPAVIYRMVESKKLPSFKVGAELRFTDKAVREYEEGVA